MQVGGWEQTPMRPASLVSWVASKEVGLQTDSRRGVYRKNLGNFSVTLRAGVRRHVRESEAPAGRRNRGGGLTRRINRVEKAVISGETRNIWNVSSCT